MRVDLQYLGKSGVKRTTGGSQELRFSPNLARDPVFFDGALKHPVRFREAMSALHEVVVSDLRFKKKDRSAYAAWKKRREVEERMEEQRLFAEVRKAKTAEIMESYTETKPPALLELKFRAMHARYWQVRRQWAQELFRGDPELFRHLVPCDPVVTVSPDVVFFECFAKDEASYGSLFVDRDAFTGESKGGLGTTNVDYSLDLYNHFQSLRTYRPTRLNVDPTGFEVKVEGMSDYREEKIDLPPSWLRGFGQLQAAMTCAHQTVTLSTDVVYAALAFLKRNRETSGPRSLRFELTPGQRPALVIEPWEERLVSSGPVYDGPEPTTIKVWGRRRLMALARVLPLTEHFTVHLTGTGLPSVWVAHMGEMRFVLALSGWTTNSWTGGANLEQLTSAHTEPPAALIDDVETHLQLVRAASLAELTSRFADAPAAELLGALWRLAQRGQIVYDFARQRYLYRKVMPSALALSLTATESPEIVAGRAHFEAGRVHISRLRPTRTGGRSIQGKVHGTTVNATLDDTGGFARGKCTCTLFFKNGLRQGPCQHLIALRLAAEAKTKGGDISELGI